MSKATKTKYVVEIVEKPVGKETIIVPQGRYAVLISVSHTQEVKEPGA